MRNNMIVVGLAALAVAALAQNEPFRPAFHFTPERNWMNDPNGLVFHEGEWHLFYQYNPHGNTWGHMSWGHAVSRDLVHWEHLPLALAEENGIMMFSGSAVVDVENRSGFGLGGRPPLVAIYTGHRQGRQDQRLAFSNDRGRTWTQFNGNPVLDVKMADFRDPKVFWHEATRRWLMVVALAAEKKVHFYASPTLKEWRYVGEFGPAGATGGLWECPDLFPLPVEGGGTKWVLIVNINPGGPVGGSGCQYFVGEFDGSKFIAGRAQGEAFMPQGQGDKPARPASENPLWADFGSDFYAAVSFSGVPDSDGRRLWLGWMSNWRYAEKVPTHPWRSAMSVPRSLGLRNTPAGPRLIQQPAAELEKLRLAPTRTFAGGTLAAANDWLQAQRGLPHLLELQTTFNGLIPGTGAVLRLQTGSDEATTLTVEATRGCLTLDRTRSGKTDFHRDFPARHEAPVRIADGLLTLRVLLDTSSIEIFAQQGETVLTELIFPSTETRGLSLTSQGEAPGVGGITLHELKAAR